MAPETPFAPRPSPEVAAQLGPPGQDGGPPAIVRSTDYVLRPPPFLSPLSGVALGREGMTDVTTRISALEPTLALVAIQSALPDGYSPSTVFGGVPGAPVQPWAQAADDEGNGDGDYREVGTGKTYETTAMEPDIFRLGPNLRGHPAYPWRGLNIDNPREPGYFPLLPLGDEKFRDQKNETREEFYKLFFCCFKITADFTLGNNNVIAKDVNIKPNGFVVKLEVDPRTNQKHIAVFVDGKGLQTDLDNQTNNKDTEWDNVDDIKFTLTDEAKKDEDPPERPREKETPAQKHAREERNKQNQRKQVAKNAARKMGDFILKKHIVFRNRRKKAEAKRKGKGKGK